MVAQVVQGHVQGDRLGVGVLALGRRAEAGEVLGGGRDAALLLCLDEVGAEVGHLVRVPAVGPLELVVEVAGRAVHVEHRGQVDVHADAAQVGRGARGRRRWPAAPGARTSPICFSDSSGAPGSRRTSPPSWSVISSSGGVHRVGAGPVGGLQLRDDAGDLRLAGDVLAEEDDAAGLAVPDQPQQPGGRVEPGVAVDHALAGQLPVRQLGQCRLRHCRRARRRDVTRPGDLVAGHGPLRRPAVARRGGAPRGRGAADGGAGRAGDDGRAREGDAARSQPERGEAHQALPFAGPRSGAAHAGARHRGAAFPCYEQITSGGPQSLPAGGKSSSGGTVS